MKKLFLLSATALVLFTGCLVTTGTYNKALDESEARRVQAEKLGQDVEAARTENAKLKNDLADLAAARQADVERLNALLDELSSKGIMTSKAIEDLKVEKARLDASDKARTAEAAGLKVKLNESVAGAEALNKELVSLKQVKDGLDVSLKARGDEIALLNATLINLTKENEYLKREVERLQLKTGEMSAQKEQELARVKTTYESLVKEMQLEIDKGDIKITQALDRLSVNMVEKILFDSGKAEVKSDGLKVLMRVGNVLKGVTDRQIRVEGHTDNVKIGGRLREKYPTNWELSTARAANVVRYLEDKVGVDRKLLSVAGMADNNPVASNDTAEGRSANRRIEIVLLPLDVDRVLEELKK
ncbi:MAG: OmpA family protein [Deltaproteobacteria bacterium]|nr:OmpA family protein [Deltaproteobacteria bacterium]